MSFDALNPLNPFFVLCVLAVALSTGALFVRAFGAPVLGHRFASLDGLRGFLALGVFIQHAAVWYYYPRTGQWDLPPSNLFRHLGQASVGLFFMITALLFTRKVIQRRDQPMDWSGLYLGRVFRLSPLYLLVIATVVASTLVIGGFALKEPLSDLASHLLSWVLFTFNGTPDINHFPNTEKITAGATWTLPYEWLFYLALPMLAVVTRREAGRWLLLFSAIGCMALAMSIPHFHLTKLAYFGGGIAAAFCVQWEALARRLRGPAASLLVLACLASVVYFFNTAYRLPVVGLLSVAFIPLVCGNTLFGLLVMPSARMLGELTYSLYLWHGVALYLLFRHGLDEPTSNTPGEHWLVVLMITPMLLLLCHTTYRFVELPGVAAAPRFREWLKARRRGTGLPAAA